MHDVSNAINSIDTEKVIDKRICTKHSWNNVNEAQAEDTGKCNGIKHSGQEDAHYKQLSHMFVKPANSGAATIQPLYMKDEGEKAKKVPQHTATTISTDVSNLTIAEKGVISSAIPLAMKSCR